VRLEDSHTTAPATNRGRRPLVSLTPLIDVVFILLVFFMLASSFSKEEVIKMLTPAATEAAGDGEAGAVLVRVRADGSLDLNGEPLRRAELAQRVAAWSVSGLPRRYLVQPVGGVTAQQVVAVMDLLRSSGAGNVSLTR